VVNLRQKWSLHIPSEIPEDSGHHPLKTDFPKILTADVQISVSLFMWLFGRKVILNGNRPSQSLPSLMPTRSTLMPATSPLMPGLDPLLSGLNFKAMITPFDLGGVGVAVPGSIIDRCVFCA